MRREVTVDLADLKRLVGMYMDQQVNSQAQVMVLNEPGQSNPTAAFEFSRLVEGATPEATRRVRQRFRSLIEALESGHNVGDALASFVNGANPTSLRRPSSSGIASEGR